MLKILQITNKVPYPPKDGGALAVLNMAKGLSKLGMDVSLLAFNTSKHHQDMNSFGSTELPYHHIWTVDLDTSISLASTLWHQISSTQAYHLKRFWSNDFRDLLKIVVKKHHFDLIQIEALYMLQYVPYIRKDSSVPVFYRAHNIEHEVWERKALTEKNILKKLFFKSLSRRIRKYELECPSLFNHLIAISPKDLEFFNTNGLAKPCIIAPVGIELQISEHTASANIECENDLFYIGALDWLPNQEGLLWFLQNCWHSVRERLPNLTLSIAGRNAPKHFSEKLKLYKNIIFSGEVDDAKEYMSKHGILIVPLFSGSGIRVKIAEAMSLGKAVITSKVGIEGIAANHGTEILIADTEQQWVQQIENLVTDQEYKARIGANARLFAQEQLDLNKISKNIVNFYFNHI